MAAIAEMLQKAFEAQAMAQADSRPDDLITTEIAPAEYSTGERNSSMPGFKECVEARNFLCINVNPVFGRDSGLPRRYS
jgi:hypothetical protein